MEKQTCRETLDADFKKQLMADPEVAKHFKERRAKTNFVRPIFITNRLKPGSKKLGIK